VGGCRGSTIDALRARAREQFEQDGFCLVPPCIPTELLARVVPHMDAVLAGEYETGVAPFRRFWNPEDGPERLRKIDDAHWADDTIRELVTHPAIGEWAAAVSGADFIQLWSCQLLVKPPGVPTGANVGWHQDLPYWSKWFTEGVFVAWVAVSDVGEDAGPVRFVRGSHRWGALEGGNFFDGGDIEERRALLSVPPGADWEEVPAILAPGAFSLHQNLVLHGSGPNVSGAPRRSFAIHLRTERGVPLPGESVHYVTELDDHDKHPVLVDRRSP
jgi:ectoine hydroxylase-related dioxygenase (phytanoyl-CoA dioxygenase family)